MARSRQVAEEGRVPSDTHGCRWTKQQRRGNTDLVMTPHKTHDGMRGALGLYARSPCRNPKGGLPSKDRRDCVCLRGMPDGPFLEPLRNERIGENESQESDETAEYREHCSFDSEWCRYDYRETNNIRVAVISSFSVDRRLSLAAFIFLQRSHIARKIQQKTVLALSFRTDRPILFGRQARFGRLADRLLGLNLDSRRRQKECAILSTLGRLRYSKSFSLRLRFFVSRLCL